MMPWPTLQCIVLPGLQYSVDLQTQTHTEPVSLKYGKLATKYLRIYRYYYSAKKLKAMLPSQVKFTPELHHFSTEKLFDS